MVDEFKCELYLNADINAILNTAKVWLHGNGFKIKEETKDNDKTFINSYTGVILTSTESATKRWLEIRVSHLSNSCYIVLYERVTSFSDHMKSDLIKDEVLALAAFLQSGGVSSSSQQQQQQQQIVVNVVPQPPPVATPTGPSPVNIISSQSTGQPFLPTQPSPAQPIMPPTEIIFCIRCGSQNVKYARFCKVCGATIE